MSGPAPERAPVDQDRSMRNIAVRTSNSVLVLQRRAEKELLEAKALLETRTTELSASVSLLNATLEAVPDGILAVDREGRIIAHNSRFAATWGLSSETIRAMHFTDLIAHESAFVADPAAFRQRKAAALANPEEESFDVVEFTDGRSFERRSVPQRIDGTCVGIVVHWRDVTDQRRSADARAALAEQLRQAQKMESLGALSGGIAHDFNNILGAILGNAELALASPSNTAGVVESLTAIREAGNRAARLVQQILTFSRQQPYALSPIAITDTVQEAVRLLRATIPAGIELTTTFAGDVPLILADATQVHQIVMNLCTNAMHALQDRSGRVGSAGRIDVAVDTGVTGVGIGREAPGTLPPGRFVRLVVRDDGIGMDEHTRSRIFEPFFTTRATGDGTGLGLSVVHGIVATHNGAISVASAPNGGTTFTLYFPALEPDRGPAHLTPLSSVAIIQESSSDHTISVLYVDDDPQIVSLVTRLLSKTGCVVTGYNSAHDALDAIRATPAAFDVVVTDFNMPGLSGLDIARVVLEQRPDLPVVITSGYITSELQFEAEKIGVQHLLYKPELAKRLLQIVRAAPRAPRP